MCKICYVLDVGRIDYKQALVLQEEYVRRKISQSLNDVLLIAEHPPVFTVGRSGGWDNLLVSDKMLQKHGISVFETTRGGNITYHGPGQVILYPILDLRNYGKDVHAYIRYLEEVAINVLKQLGVNSYRRAQLTGVWVDEKQPKKIAAIGIRVQKWISSHGMAFNVNPNMDHFHMINPCGITDYSVTSLVQLIPSLSDISYIKKLFISSFTEIFKINIEKRENCDLTAPSWLEVLRNANQPPFTC